MTARFSADDYAAAGRALLPRGRVWPGDPTSTQGQVLAAIGRTFERSDAAANSLLYSTTPGSAEMLLDGWEATLGPVVSSEIAARLRAARAAFVGTRGLSRGAYVAVANALGFSIQILCYRTPRPGEAAPQPAPPYPAAEWPHCWGVRVTARPASISDEQMLATLDAIKPAHTRVFLIA